MSKRTKDTVELFLGQSLKLHTGEDATAAMLKTLHVDSFSTIKWQDKFSVRDVMKRAWIQNEHTLLTLTQKRWAGHGTRMPD